MRKAIFAVVLLGILAPTGHALASSCGLEPRSPPLAPGCKRMKPVCACDRTGKNCQWQFVCQH